MFVTVQLQPPLPLGAVCECRVGQGALLPLYGFVEPSRLRAGRCQNVVAIPAGSLEELPPLDGIVDRLLAIAVFRIGALR